MFYLGGLKQVPRADRAEASAGYPGFVIAVGVFASAKIGALSAREREIVRGS